MTDSTRQALGALRDDFRCAAERWPTLRHAFVEAELHEALCRVNPFVFHVPRLLLHPFLQGRIVIDVMWVISANDDVSRIAAFLDEPPRDKAGLRRFRELSLSTSRCLGGDFGESAAESFVGHRDLLPNAWLRAVYRLAAEHRDPLIKVREHKLELSEDQTTFALTPGYSSKIPPGHARVKIGDRLERQPLCELLKDLAASNARVQICETGVFRASEHAIGRVLAGDWPGFAPASPTPANNDVGESDEIKALRNAIRNTPDGAHKKPEEIIRLAGVSEQKGRDGLRALEDEGVYEGFSRRRPNRYTSPS